MLNAVDQCENVLREELPSQLRITSVSTRLTNLRTQADTLLATLGLAPPTPDHAPKRGRKHSHARRTESACASELAIKQTLATLGKSFTGYKKALERRTMSPQPLAISKPHLSTDKPHPPTTKLSIPDVKKDVLTKFSDTTYVQRVRANTAEAIKNKKKVSSVLQRVEALNEKTLNEDPLLEFGTSYGPRPRANTADTAVGVAKPELPRQRSPAPSNASVSLRTKMVGVNKTERKDKINAIRKIFDASNIPDNDVPMVTVDQSDASGCGRLNTAPPSVVKAVMKDHTPTKQKVITITMETPITPSDDKDRVHSHNHSCTHSLTHSLTHTAT